MIYLLCLFLILILTQTEDILYNHTNSEDNLYFVFTTFRHGARYPFVKTDFFGNNIKAPGALTKYGGIQHLEIGKKYRERYSNFLNMSFDKNEFYLRTSDVERTIVSTEKELEGFFNKSIKRNYFHIIKNGVNFWNLFHLNDKERREMDKYSNYCNKKRRLDINYKEMFYTDIFPILEKCYGIKNKDINLHTYCDSVYTAYFQYTYGNDTNNKIGNCQKENVDKIYNFCFNYYNSFRGWNEYSAYMFYMLYQHIFDYMNNAVYNISQIKMVMIGGHDITVDKFINFLDGMKIIPRTHFPHYACNIVIELRKYNNILYIEFYYNDILKYNNTLDTFQNVLNNSKYSNLYNYCGIPPWKLPLKNETTDSNISDKIQMTNIIINESNTKEKIQTANTIINEIIKSNTTDKIPITNIILNETFQNNTTDEIQITNIIINETFQNNTTDEIQTTNIIINETLETAIEIIENKSQNISINYNQIQTETENIYNDSDIIIIKNFITDKSNKELNDLDIINKTNQDLNDLNKTNKIVFINNTKNIETNIYFQKLKKIFKIDSIKSLYIILGSLFIIVILIVIIIFCVVLKRKKKYTKYVEESQKNNNISIVSDIPAKINL